MLVDGVRVPFMRSGGHYLDLLAYDLARSAVRGLLERTGLEPASLDRVIMGIVMQNPKTSNVAREAALGAGIPNSVPAYTVTMACISSNQAITSAAELVASGQADAVIAGGTESLSDVPIGFGKALRKKLYQLRKVESVWAYRKLFRGLSLSDLVPRTPGIEEYSTGESMGEYGDKLAAMFGVSRKDQDEYALRSHQNAARATREGKLSAEITPVAVPPRFDPLDTDNTVRPDTSMDKLSKLPPVYVKPYGTITAGNASPLTDGAAATLVMSEQKALALGLTPKAYLRHYCYVAQDPYEELLLGPAYAVPKLLDEAGLEPGDIDVIEFHEAFAGQVLAVLTALGSDTFARDKLGRSSRAFEVDMDILNRWGGSISLGHPFGATGARLVTTAANRLHDEDGQFALVTACAAGGLGHALIVERYEGSA